jgi:tetratricopeptide (TPR) repeat protein
MNKKHRLLILIFSVLFFTISLCYSSQDKVVFSSADNVPGWVSKIPAEKGILYFVGISNGAKDLEEAKKAAVNNAAGQIADFLGIKVKTKYEQVTTEISTRVFDKVNTDSHKVMVQGAELKEFYYEKIQKQDGNKKATCYNGYALVSYPEEELNKEKKRLARERESRLSESDRYLSYARKEAGKGSIAQSFTDYSFALKVIEDVDGAENLVSNILNEAIGVFHRIKIVGHENDTAGTVKEGLNKPLVVKVLFTTGNSELPLKDILVNFDFTVGKGALDRGNCTDTNGFAKTRVSRILSLKSRNVVEASVNFKYLLKSTIPEIKSDIENVPSLKQDFVFNTTGSVEDILSTRVNVVVLPFKNNMSQNQSIDWLGTGLTDAINNKLSGIANIKLINYSRGIEKIVSSDFYCDKLKKEYEVDYIVSGGFQSIKGEIKVNSSITVTDGCELAGTVQESGVVADIFKMEDTLSIKIAGVLKVSLTDEDRVRMMQLEVTSVPAYEYFCKGIEYYEKGDYDNALKMYDKSIIIDSKYFAPYNNEGVIYYLQRKYDDAIVSYQKSLELNPLKSDTVLNIGVVYYKKGDNEKAISAFKKAIELNRFNTNAYKVLGALYNENQLYDEAIAVLKRAVETEKNDPDLYNSFGIALDGKGRYDEAIDSFKQAINTDPLFLKAYNNAGISYEHKGLYNEAINAYKAVLEYGLSDANLWNNVGHGYLKNNMPDSAQFCLLKAIEIDNNSIPACYNLAGLYSIKNQLDLSVDYLKKAIKLGYKDYAFIESDNMFNNLRKSTRYVEIINELKKH